MCVGKAQNDRAGERERECWGAEGVGLKYTLNGLRLERPLECDSLVREQPASKSGTCRLADYTG